MALYDALRVVAKEQGTSGPEHYLLGQVAAVSVGVVKDASNRVDVWEDQSGKTLH